MTPKAATKSAGESTAAPGASKIRFKGHIPTPDTHEDPPADVAASAQDSAANAQSQPAANEDPSREPGVSAQTPAPAVAADVEASAPRAADRGPDAAPPADPIGDALAALEANREAREREAQEARDRQAAEQAAAFAQYLELLQRRKTPQTDDAATLVQLALQLGFSREQVQEDVRILDHADGWQARIAGRAALRQERDKARAERKQARVALEAADLRMDKLHSNLKSLISTEIDLHKLRSGRPDLFPVPIAAADDDSEPASDGPSSEDDTESLSDESPADGQATDEADDWSADSF